VWLVVGLGNPGASYAKTRHNLGFMVVDRLIERLGAHALSSSSFHGELFKHRTFLLLKPTTFMNRSGLSVQAVQHFYKIDPEQIIVIHDDLDLAFGALRLKRGGGSGGHNGLKSIDAAIGNGYLRVRMGIGKPIYKSQTADYVLHPFSEEEQRCLAAWIDFTAETTQELTHRTLEEVASTRSMRRMRPEFCR